ncbi:TMV resistance protein N-like [Arachis hypogaea]|nr:TMV resistance protein N-like [Arachis hypogaea]
MFQNIEDLNVEECPQLPKLLWKVLKVRIDSLPKLSRLNLKSCDLSDKDLELILSCFLQLKWLTPDCIDDLSSLLMLYVDNCNQLRDVSVLPPDGSNSSSGVECKPYRSYCFVVNQCFFFSVFYYF